MCKKREWNFLALFIGIFLLFVMTAAVYGADITDTGSQPVRDYTVGDKVPASQEADVDIQGTASNGKGGSQASQSRPGGASSTTIHGGGAYDPITGGKTVKTGDEPLDLAKYIAVFILGGGLFWFFLRRQAKDNER